jgi:hypothetical protein
MIIFILMLTNVVVTGGYFNALNLVCYRTTPEWTKNEKH